MLNTHARKREQPLPLKSDSAISRGSFVDELVGVAFRLASRSVSAPSVLEGRRSAAASC